MENVKWVDALRARASYGEVGNDAAVNFYGYQALYYITKNGGNPALVRQKLAALDLKWETTQTFDFGVEGTLFDRLNFSLGYFDKRSKDLLFEVRFPLSAGSFFGNDAIENLTQYQNIGTISNRGFEIMLNGDVVRRVIGRAQQARVRVRQQRADHGNRANVEEHDAPEHRADRAHHVLLHRRDRRDRYAAAVHGPEPAERGR